LLRAFKTPSKQDQQDNRRWTAESNKSTPIDTNVD